MIIALILLLVVAAVLVGGAYYAYRIAFYSPNKDREKLPSTSSGVYDPYRPEMRRLFQLLQNRPCEFVTVRSHDGLLLSGRYYHVQDGAPLDICFHGYHSAALTDFCGGSDLSLQMGHNLLLVDQRAHGKSEGSTITFGILERRDALCWIDYALNRFGRCQEILLYGISMGGATVLMAAGLKLPSNVVGIVADCPYSSPLDIILQVGRSMPIPLWLIKPFVILGARIFGGFDLLETTAMECVKNTRVPILVIHGDSDTLVPREMSLPLAEANPQMVRHCTVYGAEHGISYLVDTPRYVKFVNEFMEKVL